MRFWVVLLLLALVVTGCGGGVLKKQYEYEEELYLALDGTATLNVNASIPALAALRGARLNVNAKSRFDRDAVRAFFEGPGVTVTAISSSRRKGRRFAHVSLQVADVRALQRVSAFAWSSYRFDREGDVLDYRQTVGPSANAAIADVGWTGAELVAFRMHIPSKIPFHNAPSHEVSRGNIVEWEQPLAERLKGVPVDIQVQMATTSILSETLLLFASTVVAAFATLAAIIWWVARRGRDEPQAPPAR